MKAYNPKAVIALALLVFVGQAGASTMSVCLPSGRGPVHIAGQCSKGERAERVNLMVLTPEVAKEIRDLKNLDSYIRKASKSTTAKR